jgi:hypothetical protein
LIVKSACGYERNFAFSQGGIEMKKNILSSTMILVLVVAAMPTSAFPQATPGLEGVWFSIVTPIDCTTHNDIQGAATFRGLNMFSQDGSVTNEAAFLVPNIPARSGGVGQWQHTQGHMYTATFRFFRYKPVDGSLMAVRLVTLQTIIVSGNQFTSIDQFQDFDANLNPVAGSTGCNREDAVRLQ